MMQSLDVSTFPLNGRSLIEASAGTGKTWTIAALYSRLLLGHGLGGQRLGCDRILVVTFTNAATEELRGRIRERVRNNLDDVLRLQHGQPVEDELFGRWVAESGISQSAAVQGGAELSGLDELASWLQVNLAQMDSAAVFTIHGFCQRMLQQFAFDSGVMFSSELVLDSVSYLRQACEDVWRNGQYSLDRDQVLYLQSLFPTPQALQQRLREWLNRSGLTFVPPRDEAFSFEQSWQQLAQAIRLIREQFQDLGAQGLVDLISGSGLSGTYYRKTLLPGWVAGIERWLQQPASMTLPTNLERFGSGYVSNPDKLKKNGKAPEHPLFDAIQHLLDLKEPLRVQLLQHWHQQVRERYLMLLERDGAMSADDLLRLLDQALQGPQGPNLATQIRQLFPIALIDEFQDTDPLQYRIFSSIYQEVMPGVGLSGAGESGAGESGQAITTDQTPTLCGLSAIGDPKQAIYSFRGADIFTYIEARRQQPAERIFTLDTNWRSHSKLINAVNQLFLKHPSPFVFDSDIPFVEVKAGGRQDRQAFSCRDSNGDWQPQAPLQLWVDSTETSRAAALRQCAADAASQIASLLAGAGRIGDQPVAAADIAVLVRSHSQANLMQKALAEVGVGSVFLSRDSVFKTREALDLLIWLTAVAEPADEHAVRNALATETHGYSAERLDRLLHDEGQWEIELEQVQNWHQCWLQRGVMAALLLWLEDQQRALRLRQLARGERRLTNLLHLGELLQQASRRLRGHQALLRWFADQVMDDRERDEAQLRLESDANLVSIVTIHKSKGLAYPLVFLPFLWSDSHVPRPASKADPEARYFDDRRGVVVDLDPDDDALALQGRDSRAEAMRLLYVALTRPQQGCFIWMPNALSYKKPVLASSALGDWLQVNEYGVDLAGLPPQQWPDGLWIGALPSWCADNSVALPAPEPVLPRRFGRSLYDSWRVSSFTGLSRNHQADADIGSEDEMDDWLARGSDGPLREDESGPAADALLAPALINDATLMPAAASFARGANAGTCLHAIFEHWDFRSRPQLEEQVQQQLRRYGLLASGDARRLQIEGLADWYEAIAATPLMVDGSGGFRLADVNGRQRLDELEFCLPIQRLQASALTRLLQSERQSGDLASLNFSPVSGYLKGFIDLLVCVDGRYYLLDYKSNHLGDHPADYAQERLHSAMAAHHYDLQAWIYSLALDRLLQQRVPDYDPARHLGGIIYLFVRGMGHPDYPDSGVFSRQTDVRQLQQWRQLMLINETGEPS